MQHSRNRDLDGVRGLAILLVVAAHSGLAEVAAELGASARSFDGSVEDLVRALEQVLSLAAGDRRRHGMLGRERVAALWSWERVAERLLASASG